MSLFSRSVIGLGVTCGLSILVESPMCDAAIVGALQSTGSGSVVLTTEGTLDWAHWGEAGGAFASHFDHKLSGGGLISDLSSVGGATFQPVTQVDDPSRPGENDVGSFTWADGTPDIAALNTTTAIAANAGFYSTNNGYSFTVDSDSTQRTLKIYLGTQNADGQLTAHLSDGSPDYVGVFTGQGYRSKNGVYSLDYSSAAPGTLTVSFVFTDRLGEYSDGAAVVQAATLSAVPEPASLAALSLATSAVLIRRRRFSH